MGREIRRVAPGWEHPKKRNEYNGEMHYRPMFDESYETARARWLEGFQRWELGEKEHYLYGTGGRIEWVPKEADDIGDYWEEESPPEREMYRPHWTPEEATAYQVYETVSEGTPVSPVCLTREALIDWLVNDGDGMGIEPRRYRMTRAQAERFIEIGGAPSLIVSPERGVQSGVEALLT